MTIKVGDSLPASMLTLTMDLLVCLPILEEGDEHLNDHSQHHLLHQDDLRESHSDPLHLNLLLVTYSYI